MRQRLALPSAQLVSVSFAAVWLAATTASPALSQAYHGRRAWTLANDRISVVVTPGGGHIASLSLNAGSSAGLNPLWLPPWNSLEPGSGAEPTGYYGDPPGAVLLQSILGHNLCLDFFGAPSPAETLAGIPVHGEAPVQTWRLIENAGGTLAYSTRLPLANLDATRTIRIAPQSSALWITERVVNRSPFDRPIGWQEHVTLGPPFLAAGQTVFDTNGTWSTVYPHEFSKGERLKRGAEFEWPLAEAANGEQVDLREYPTAARNSDFTATLVPADQKWGWFTALNRRAGLLIGYVWPRADFPWLGNWEENHFRTAKPWNGKAVARGMEFGTTPFPDSRRDSVSLGRLHGAPTFRWISADSGQTVGYGAFITPVPAGTTGAKRVTVAGDSIVVELEGASKPLRFPVRR
jgi:hypothetical protein